MTECIGKIDIRDVYYDTIELIAQYFASRYSRWQGDAALPDVQHIIIILEHIF